MATNLALDDELILRAQKAGKHKTKREAVNAALAEYVRHRAERQVIDLFGTLDMPGDHELAAMRGKKRRRR